MKIQRSILMMGILVFSLNFFDVSCMHGFMAIPVMPRFATGLSGWFSHLFSNIFHSARLHMNRPVKVKLPNGYMIRYPIECKETKKCHLTDVCHPVQRSSALNPQSVTHNNQKKFCLSSCYLCRICSEKRRIVTYKTPATATDTQAGHLPTLKQIEKAVNEVQDAVSALNATVEESIQDEKTANISNTAAQQLEPSPRVLSAAAAAVATLQANDEAGNDTLLDETASSAASSTNNTAMVVEDTPTGKSLLTRSNAVSSAPSSLESIKAPTPVKGAQKAAVAGSAKLKPDTVERIEYVPQSRSCTMCMKEVLCDAARLECDTPDTRHCNHGNTRLFRSFF